MPFEIYHKFAALSMPNKTKPALFSWRLKFITDSPRRQRSGQPKSPPTVADELC
ncbi:MAG: hypothetical protein IKN16_11375 [Selenomonadaceae bacterium]|nr:hypothetical protein [Selenomonadaceae bacterium]